MDLVTTGMMSRQPESVTEREESAQPNGKSAVGNLVDRVEEATGSTFDASTRSSLTTLVHYSLGVVPAVLYAWLRPRLPMAGALRGLLYGTLLWAFNDEYLNARLGLSGPPEAYPVETHARGAAGHLVLGAATDTFLDVLGG